jgi:hypothetical protein
MTRGTQAEHRARPRPKARYRGGRAPTSWIMSFDQWRPAGAIPSARKAADNSVEVP